LKRSGTSCRLTSSKLSLSPLPILARTSRSSRPRGFAAWALFLGFRDFGGFKPALFAAAGAAELVANGGIAAAGRSAPVAGGPADLPDSLCEFGWFVSFISLRGRDRSLPMSHDNDAPGSSVPPGRWPIGNIPAPEALL
jgi:hypothetical protein